MSAKVIHQEVAKRYSYVLATITINVLLLVLFLLALKSTDSNVSRGPLIYQLAVNFITSNVALWAAHQANPSRHGVRVVSLGTNDRQGGGGERQRVCLLDVQAFGKRSSETRVSLVDCWLEPTDANGVVSLEGTHERGVDASEIELPGRFTVVVEPFSPDPDKQVGSSRLRFEFEICFPPRFQARRVRCSLPWTISARASKENQCA